MALKYTGDGKNIATVPMHDLTDEDIERLAARDGYTVDEYTALLTARGIYSAIKPRKSTPKTKDTDTESSEGGE